VPGGSNPNLYVPSASVVEVRAWAVSILVAVTVTLGTTPPDVSFTVPVNDPVEAVWLNAGGSTSIERRTRTAQHKIEMRLSICFEVLADIEYTPN
jgi:hypothetical protein